MTAERELGRTIVVGYDGSDPARRALKRAADLGANGGSVVVMTAAHAVVSDARTGQLVDPSEAEERDRLLVEARTTLAQNGIAASTLAKEGDPGAALIEAAEEAEATVLVVGTRGRNRLAKTLLGSVSTRVVHDAPCDVLVVR